MSVCNFPRIFVFVLAFFCFCSSFAGLSPSPRIFTGDARTAYRDPTAIWAEERCRLFFTLVETEADGSVHSYVATSSSADLKAWTPPRKLTPRSDRDYSSPGNVVWDGDTAVLCFQSYPRPGNKDDGVVRYADKTARLFTMRTKDFENWTTPELLRVKGENVAEADMGRMIDPYLVQNPSGEWLCYYKQNGVSFSRSKDLRTWEFVGRAEAGENVCVVRDGERYVMMHSPRNGMRLKTSTDLLHWTDLPGEITLNQKAWPWAKGRLTAGFLLDCRSVPSIGKWVLFFHGSGPKTEPEGHFDRFASLAFVQVDRIDDLLDAHVYRETETDVEAREVGKPAADAVALKIVEGPDWVPFTYFKNIEAGSALDFSGLPHLDRPAGKHGRVIVKDGHFAFADRPEISRHFWGCNINGEAMCPDHALAVEVAERLARTGYNAVRIHHYDSPITATGNGRTELDPVQMEKFDFFVAELVKRGIYLETDLFVSRGPLLWRDLGIDRDGEVERYSKKALMSFYPPAYSNWCAFARSFLTHRNPYTGTTVAELPWIGISLINEGRFVYPFPTLPKVEAFQAKWRAWIAARRAADPTCYPELGPKPNKYPRVEWADQNQGTIPRAAADFCADLEREFMARARPFLASLGVKAPLSNQNNSVHYAAMGLVRDEIYDFFDIHSYGGGMGKDKMPTPCSAANPLTPNGDRIERTVFARPWTSPVVISEWNYGWPNPHRPAGTFKTATIAALQDWGAIFRFAYTHGLPHLHEGKFKASRFDVALDYANLASERLAFALFARGDLKPLVSKMALEIDSAARDTPENWAKGICPTNWNPLTAWRTAWGVSAPGRVPDGMRSMKLSAAMAAEPQDVGTDRPDVAYDPVRGTLAVTTPCSAVVAAPSGKMAAGPFAVDFGAAPCTAFALALDGKPLVASGRLLVSCLGDIQFNGIEYVDATRTVIRKKGDYGRPLVRDMKIPVSLELDPQAAYTVYALDTAGRRIGTLPVSGASRPALCFTAATRGPDGRGVLNWEIVRK